MTFTEFWDEQDDTFKHSYRREDIHDVWVAATKEERGFKNDSPKIELVKEGVLNLRSGGGVILDHGLWAASAGIQDEIKQKHPGCNEFLITIIVRPKGR